MSLSVEQRTDEEVYQVLDGSSETQAEAINVMCAYLFEGLEAWNDVTADKATAHLKEIITYLSLTAVDVVRIFVIIKRYLRTGKRLRHVLEASEIFHYAAFASNSHDLDINIGKTFWSHVTAKRFYLFYNEVLKFLDCIDWKLKIETEELARNVRYILSAINANKLRVLERPATAKEPTVSEKKKEIAAAEEERRALNQASLPV